MKKRRDKGQISIFIIIAVVLVLVVASGGLFFVKGKTNIFMQEQVPETLKFSVSQMRFGIEDCVSSGLIDGVALIGLQGGYIRLPDKSIEAGALTTSYGYYGGKNLVPSKEKISEDLGNFIKRRVELCIYRDPNLNINPDLSQMITKIKLDDDKIVAQINFPISISDNSSSYLLKETYEKSLDLNLGNMIDSANRIIEEQKKNPDYIPIGVTTESGYDVLITNIDEKNVIYSIVDLSSGKKLQDVAYSFSFASKLGDGK